MRKMMTRIKKVFNRMFDAYESAQKAALETGDPFVIQNFRTEILY